MSSKHVVNDPRNLVNDALAGLVQLSPDLSLDAANRVTYLTRIPQDKVALISGGGSGHEPSHAGFVGQGLLSAAVSGNVFASPNVGQIRRALDLVDNKKGTLAIIMRYTGDVLLFGLAKEQYAVTHPGHPMELVIVGDDCAVPRKQGAIVGRRGLAGTVLVYKIASALAQTGASIAESKALAELVAERVGTIGVGLSHCHIPGTAVGTSHLEVDEVEIGMGIHNEPGIEKIKLPSSRELVARMLGLITSTSDPERSFLPFELDGRDQVVLMINNLGGISELEVTSIVNDALTVLKEQDIIVKRVMAGSFMTSLNLPGFSITLLLLPRTGPTSSSTILDLLDCPASSVGWKHASLPREEAAVVLASSSTVMKSRGNPVPFEDFTLFTLSLKAACKNLIEAEPEITQYDTIAGDGDCGLTLKAGAESVLALLENNGVDSEDCVMAVLNFAQVIEKSMDGTSGALYSIWTNALAAGLAAASASGLSGGATSAVWAVGLAHALKTLYNYTAARPPSRTLVDPLAAFTESFSTTGGADFETAYKAALEAAEKTRNIEATAGRAAYVGQDVLKAQKVPDPGAWGVIKILQGIHSVL